MRLYTFALLVLAAPLVAQEPTKRLTEADYARAERWLGTNTAPLVTGVGVRPVWLEDNRFWYRTTVPGGSAFYLVDPTRRTRTNAFDAQRLATALSSAAGGRFVANALPFQTFE